MNMFLIVLAIVALLFIGFQTGFLELYLGKSQDVVDKLAM